MDVHGNNVSKLKSEAAAGEGVFSKRVAVNNSNIISG